MIVARSFSPPSSSFMSEKNDRTNSSSRSPLRQRSRSPQRSAHTPTPTSKSSTSSLRSNPVKIPTKNVRPPPQPVSRRSDPTTVKSKPTAALEIPAFKPRRESAQEILSATAIPIRKRAKGRPSQRLPNCDYVADFSRLLLDDVQPNKDGSLVRNQSMPQLEGLFGHIDELVEGQIIVGSEGIDESAMSARSISSDSLASLASPDDYGFSQNDHRSNMARSPQGRHTPIISHAEDCSKDHPLVNIDDIESLSLNAAESTPSPLLTPSSSRTTSPPPKKETTRSSFKSTLTSSLKALKSAARTTLLSTSGFGAHSGATSASLYNNESLLAHNFFDIQPSLTDDRRPPPTMTRPSPELRRYLNPQMASAPPDSPTQLHFWQDERDTFDPKRETQIMKEKIKQNKRRRRSPQPKSRVKSLPAVVPLATCLPPTVRTANASSPPIWLTPDGEPVNKNTSNSLLFDPDATTVTGNGIPKNREPRENRDFLRMFVCEMEMRRNGKLSDDLSAGRARLWLPPLAGFQATNGAPQPVKRVGADRWQVWGPADLEGQAGSSS